MSLTLPSTNRRSRFNSGMSADAKAAFQQPEVQSYIKKMRGRLQEARAGERGTQGNIRSDINKFVMPILAETYQPLATARGLTNTPQGRINYMKLYNDALSRASNAVLDANWSNILITQRDQQKDERLQSKYASNPLALLKARKGAHRVSIQRWWMINKNDAIKSLTDIARNNPASMFESLPPSGGVNDIIY